MRYFLYCRKSTESEDRQVMSLESQLAEVSRILSAHDQVQIVAKFTEAQSAKEIGRPVFNDMIARLEAGEADGIAAWAPDRLARNSMDGGKIVHLLDQKKLKDLKFATYSFENNSQGKFMLSIMFGQSKYYSDALSENVKRGIRTKLSKGLLPGRPPIGYLIDPVTRAAVIDPQRGPLVRKLFDLAATGATSGKQLAETARYDWGLYTVPTARTGGRPMSISAIYKTLSNPFYAGTILHDGQSYPGAHIPLITAATYGRVQSHLARRGKARPQKHTFDYTGLLNCGSCSGTITAERKTNKYGSTYTYYHCAQRSREGCRERSIEERDLFDQFCSILESMQMPHDLSVYVLETAGAMNDERLALLRAKRASLNKALEELDTQTGELTSLRLRRLISDEEFVAMRNEQVAEASRLKSALSNLESSDFENYFEDLVWFLKSALKCFLEGDREARRTILKIACSNFFLTGKKVNVQATDALLPRSKIAPILFGRGQGYHIRTFGAGDREESPPPPPGPSDFKRNADTLLRQMNAVVTNPVNVATFREIASLREQSEP